MTKKKVIGIVAATCVIAGVGGFLWWQFAHKGSAQSQADAVYVEKVSTVAGLNISGQNAFSGVLEAQKTLDLKLDADKKLDQILVKEGQQVHIGDPLFQYDADEMTLKLQAAQLELEGIQNKIATLKAQIATLEADKAKAKQENQLEYSLQIQSAQLEVKTEEYNITAKQAEMAQIQKSIDHAVVTSEMDGTVKAINENSSGTDMSGNPKPFMSILADGNYSIKCKASELNISQLSEEMPMIVTSRVNADQTWTGKLLKIDRENAATDQKNGISYGGSEDTMTQATKYYFYITLENYDGLMLGQHVLAAPDFGDGEKKEGLWLPSFYVIQEETGSAWVWAESAAQTMEKRQVTLGKTDDEMGTIQVLSGLTAADSIAFPDDSITEGAPATHYIVSDSNEEVVEPGGNMEFQNGVSSGQAGNMGGDAE